MQVAVIRICELLAMQLIVTQGAPGITQYYPSEGQVCIGDFFVALRITTSIDAAAAAQTLLPSSKRFSLFARHAWTTARTVMIVILIETLAPQGVRSHQPI
jgi:hypothetical protein